MMTLAYYISLIAVFVGGGMFFYFGAYRKLNGKMFSYYAILGAYLVCTGIAGATVTAALYTIAVTC